jgi:hypothetical protein
MIVFLAAFTVFNAFLGLVAVRRAGKLTTAEGRAWWQSQRLYAIACFAAWSLPVICVLATVGAWLLHGDSAGHWAAPTILAPVGWLLAMGAFFAVVDVAEDGVMDFGRGPRKGSTPD